jgi:hypothetical protein
MRHFVVISALTCLNLTQVYACPVGPNEETLTLSRVMRNFDKYSRLAQSSVGRGLENPTSVSNVEIEQVITDFTVIDSCTEAVLSSEGFDLLPVKAKRLTGQEQIDFIAKYFDYMTRFKAEAILYSDEFETLRSQTIEERDFTKANRTKKSFNALIDDAHTQF